MGTLAFAQGGGLGLQGTPANGIGGALLVLLLEPSWPRGVFAHVSRSRVVHLDSPPDTLPIRMCAGSKLGSPPWCSLDAEVPWRVFEIEMSLEHSLNYI